MLPAQPPPHGMAGNLGEWIERHVGEAGKIVRRTKGKDGTRQEGWGEGVMLIALTVRIMLR